MEVSSDFLFDISKKSFRLLRGKDPLNLTKILSYSNHIQQALDFLLDDQTARENLEISVYFCIKQFF